MKRVVVIGGGFCGAYVAKHLQNEFKVTLIDTKDYFEFTPGILRLAVEPNHASKIRVPHKEYLTNGKLIEGRVSDVNEKYVFVDKKRVPYDYLVVAAGDRYGTVSPSLKAIPAYQGKVLEEKAKAISKANKILIIGGGLVGVELAAEICTTFPKKEITIVHSGSRLVERNHPRAIVYATEFLKKKGVKTIMGHRMIRRDGQAYITDKGERVEADLVFVCSGVSANAGFMEKNFSSMLNEKRAINVNEYLNVDKKIFAGGDVLSFAEEKTAQSAERHAEIIVHNIRALENGKKMKKYVIKKRAMLISLGKWNGILQSGSFVMSGIIPALIKKFVEWRIVMKQKFV